MDPRRTSRWRAHRRHLRGPISPTFQHPTSQNLVQDLSQRVHRDQVFHQRMEARWIWIFPLQNRRGNCSFVSIIIKFVVDRISTRPVHDRELHRNPWKYNLYLYVRMVGTVTFYSGGLTSEPTGRRVVYREIGELLVMTEESRRDTMPTSRGKSYSIKIRYSGYFSRNSNHFNVHPDDHPSKPFRNPYLAFFRPEECQVPRAYHNHRRSRFAYLQCRKFGLGRCFQVEV